MNSWDRSDTVYDIAGKVLPVPMIGENDMSLLHRLSVSGSDHGKFLRMITVAVDLTAPLYWWKEFDTYKVGTVANSCSTMHKIHAKEFELDDFSYEHLFDSDKEQIVEEDWVDISEDGFGGEEWDAVEFVKMIVRALNVYRERYLVTKDKKYWWQMIQLLPSSYNQMRTVTLNYEVLKRIYFARRHHKLEEWHTLCNWIEELPYFKQIVLEGETDD